VSTKARPEVLRKAAQVLREGGWVQGALQTSRGQHCTLGALWEALYGGSVQPEVNLLSELIGDTDSSEWEVLIDWNDYDGRTEADVLTLLEQAAEKLEADCT
jgi:hypothetical protein